MCELSKNRTRHTGTLGVHALLTVFFYWYACKKGRLPLFRSPCTPTVGRATRMKKACVVNTRAYANGAWPL